MTVPDAAAVAEELGRLRKTFQVRQGARLFIVERKGAPQAWVIRFGRDVGCIETVARSAAWSEVHLLPAAHEVCDEGKVAWEMVMQVIRQLAMPDEVSEDL